MILNTESSLLSLLVRKSVIDSDIILNSYHKNCMYKKKTDSAELSYNEVSIQCQQDSTITCTDEQTQVSPSNECRDTQTCYSYSPFITTNHQSISSFQQPYPAITKRCVFINPYAIIDRVNQGEQFLKFLYKQNRKLDFIYSRFLKHLQKYVDNFLFPLQQQHGLYGSYRQDMIR